MQIAGINVSRLAIAVLAVGTVIGGYRLISSAPQDLVSDNTPATIAAEQNAALAKPNLNTEQNEQINSLLHALYLADLIGRSDLIESRNRQLSALAPQHIETVFYRGYLALLENNPERLATAKAQLQAFAPHSVRPQQLAELSAAFAENQALLQQIRLLSAAGRVDEAMAQFDGVFPSGIPVLNLQFEYLRLKARKPEYWSGVRKEFAALNAQYPNIPLLELTLADHLRKRDPFSSEAENTYRRLAFGPGIGRQAAASWLTMLAEQRIDQNNLAAYAELASRYPADIEIQQRYRQAQEEQLAERERMRDPYYRAMRIGLRDLEKERIDDAERQLRYALEGRPRDAGVLGGLGKIALRRGQHDEALRYFQLARQYNNNPDDERKWNSLITTASYWRAMNLAKSYREAGRFASANAEFENAIRIDPAPYHPYLGLASVAALRNDDTAAHQQFNIALQHAPLAAELLNAMIRHEHQFHGTVAALSVIDGLTPRQQSVLSDLRNELKAEDKLERLAHAETVGDLQSMAILIDALRNTDLRLSPWQRSRVADAMRHLGQVDEANDYMRHHTASEDSPDAHFAYALYLSRNGDTAAAITELKTIPNSQRSNTVISTLQRLEIDLVYQEMRSNGKSEAALDKALHRLAQQSRQDSNAQIRIAKLFLERDKPSDAKQVLGQIKPSAEWPLSTQLDYGNALISAAEFRAFETWFASLELNTYPAERRQPLQKLRARYQLARAQKLEAEGKPLLAYSFFSQSADQVGEHVISARLGVLRTSAAIGEWPQFRDQSKALLASREQMNGRELLELASSLDAVNETAERDATLDHLASRRDSSAQELRDAMLLAEQHRDWSRVEALAFAGLDRHAKNGLLVQQNDTAKKAGREEKVSSMPKPKPSSIDITHVKDDADFVEKAALYHQADDSWVTRSLRAGIDRAQHHRGGHILFGLDMSTKSGFDDTTEIPVELRWPMPEHSGHLLVRLDYVSITSGKRDYIDPDPAPLTSFQRRPFSSTASGIAPGIGWEAENWWLDIGSTPLGFDQQNVVGGIGLNGKIAQLGWNIALSQRAETGTALSYSGMTVPNSANIGAGTEWGGVMSTGLKLGLSRDRGETLGLWSSFQFHQLHGDTVEDNKRLAAMGGIYWRAINQEHRQLRLGVNLMHLSYEKNLDEFTLQHGGYYSPQRYFSISLPIRLFGRAGDLDWSYLLGASVSHSARQEDAPLGLDGNSSSASGFGFGVEAAIERRVSGHWYVGLAADIQRADFYEPDHISLYARYTFEKRYRALPMPPEPPRLYDTFD